MKYDVVVVAGGKGIRSNLGYNKVFFIMNNNKTVLENACRTFLEDNDCVNVIVVTSDKDKVFKHKKVKVVDGGEKRANSVYNGLKLVTSEYVLVHDGARPFLINTDLEKLKKEVEKSDAAILVKKVNETVKKVNNGFIESTLDRNNIYLALTPQGFRTKLLLDLYNKTTNYDFTDEASLLEQNNFLVKIVEGDSNNIKLTLEKDFVNI